MKPWTKRDLMAYLDRVLPALDELDHFELLDVAASATANDIQSAFHSMAAGLHPDRHRNQLTPEQHEKLIVVYARIAEAYRVLRDPDNKAAYLKKAARSSQDAGVDRARSTGGAAGLALLSPKAQQLYRRSMAAQQTGDLASAKLNLRMALSKHPQSIFLKEALRGLES